MSDETGMIINLAGSAFERGQQLGLKLKSKLQKAMALWKTSFYEANDVTLQSYVEFIKDEKFFQSTIEQYAPEYLEEVRGLADSADLPFELLYAWQLADEHYWLVKRFKSNGFVAEEGCSTFGVMRDNGDTVIAQNLDIPAYKNGLQVILKIGPEDQQQVVFTQAGILGSFGCNTWGLALCVNTVSELGHDENGLPVSYFVRKILESKTIDEAEQKIRSIPHASGQNYLLGGHGYATNFECCGDRVHVIPLKDEGFVCHTNHSLAPDHSPQVGKKVFFGATSKPRYEQITRHVRTNQNKPVDQLIEGLFDKPVFIAQESPTSGMATFHMAYFILGESVQAYYFDVNDASRIAHPLL